MYGSPDFAAIAAQILDKSFSTDGLVPTHEEAETYFGSPPSASANDLKMERESSASKITVAAAKQNMATVAARIAAIEHKEKGVENHKRGVITFFSAHYKRFIVNMFFFKLLFHRMP